MYTPYDWQEGIGNRASFIEGRLAQGAPVLAVSISDGIVLFTYRRQSRKIYEIYDRLVFAGIGQQSDVEALRLAGLEFASREGFNRSDEDVTIQRIATAMSAPIKRAFGDFSVAPVAARCLFGEVNETREEDLYYVIDYDGDYATSTHHAVIAGTHEVAEEGRKRLEHIGDVSLDESVAALREIWLDIQGPEGVRTREEVQKELSEKGLVAEAMLLERSGLRENRFRELPL